MYMADTERQRNTNYWKDSNGTVGSLRLVNDHKWAIVFVFKNRITSFIFLQQLYEILGLNLFRLSSPPSVTNINISKIKGSVY
jgi:hypothetical protein